MGLECLNGGVKITMSGVEPTTEKSIFLSHEPDLIHMPLDRTCIKKKNRLSLSDKISSNGKLSKSSA